MGNKRAFLNCEKKKGKDIADLVLEENRIDIQLCRGQGYDNGSNIYNGVQAQKNPQAVYLPCSAHSLNLCEFHAVESSTVVKSFFGNITICLVAVHPDGRYYKITLAFPRTDCPKPIGVLG